MTKILITGGSGFIGTNLIANLDHTRYHVLNIDISPPKIGNHRQYWKNVDILNYSKLSSIIKDFEPELVIHLAARTDLDGATIDDYEANTVGVQNLLNVLERISKLKTVIFASSMYVCIPGYIPNNDEDYRPHTIYGESKVMTEKIIKSKDKDYKWAIVRPTSIWGPYFGEPYNLFFKIVLSGTYFHLGKQACKKTYGYIDNTIAQIFALLNADKNSVNGKVFYLGDYDAYNISNWADEIASINNSNIRTVPFFLFRTAAILGDVLKRIGIKFPMTSFRLKNMTTDNVHNLSLIKEIFPVLPVSRPEGTRRTIKWLQN